MLDNNSYGFMLGICAVVYASYVASMLYMPAQYYRILFLNVSLARRKPQSRKSRKQQWQQSAGAMRVDADGDVQMGQQRGERGGKRERRRKMRNADGTLADAVVDDDMDVAEAQVCVERGWQGDDWY